MFRRFLGGAYSKGEICNTNVFWSDVPTPGGNFARPVRNKRGKIIGYRERHGLEDSPSIGAQKAAKAWNRRRQGWKFWIRWGWLGFQVWFIRTFYGRML